MEELSRQEKIEVIAQLLEEGGFTVFMYMHHGRSYNFSMVVGREESELGDLLMEVYGGKFSQATKEPFWWWYHCKKWQVIVEMWRDMKPYLTECRVFCELTEEYERMKKAKEKRGKHLRVTDEEAGALEDLSGRLRAAVKDWNKRVKEM